jgi:predicted MPP superfamily phosphohydrolase
MAVKAQAKFIQSLDTKIDYVLSGHIHEAYISDMFGRSGSTVGNNAFNFDGLNITGRASQNCYVVSPAGSIHGFKIDLQDVDHIEGYDIQKSLEAYHAKSAEKNLEETTVFRVVI